MDILRDLRKWKVVAIAAPALGVGLCFLATGAIAFVDWYADPSGMVRFIGGWAGFVVLLAAGFTAGSRVRFLRHAQQENVKERRTRRKGSGKVIEYDVLGDTPFEELPLTYFHFPTDFEVLRITRFSNDKGVVRFRHPEGGSVAYGITQDLSCVYGVELTVALEYLPFTYDAYTSCDPWEVALGLDAAYRFRTTPKVVDGHGTVLLWKCEGYPILFWIAERNFGSPHTAKARSLVKGNPEATVRDMAQALEAWTRSELDRRAWEARDNPGNVDKIRERLEPRTQKAMDLFKQVFRVGE